jgi:hypothetical protein
LIGPLIYTGKGAIIYAAAPMPDGYAEFADLFKDLGNGNRLFPVIVNHNRNSLAAFLASGLDDVPQPLVEHSRQRLDEVTRDRLIAFSDCPLVGRIENREGIYEIEYPFPRSTLRDDFVSWLMRWGISFRVEQ